MTERYDLRPFLGLDELRFLIKDGQFIGEKSGKPKEFKKLIALNPYIYEDDVAYTDGAWLYVYGPGDWNEVTFYAEYLTDEGQLDFRADDNASEWEEVNNEKYEV
ncbi:hypothetical protein PP939_gp255 [Rhizobium phage RL38J1]|uniref:Uncharacterized protein n=1 Tax=Rhizobium phage RL38J1 TaxID=2663232 RepID=A0A6B9J1H9_9CAUD|nr:hypothetical protein PP939_gp255 [Rhizobium phage RL38J1]QGZ13980.1 hypothetical protein RL38J1_255 [Rhizobium phage RL38J1]